MVWVVVAGCGLGWVAGVGRQLEIRFSSNCVFGECSFGRRRVVCLGGGRGFQRLLGYLVGPTAREAVDSGFG